jgi:hypothetical protein
MTAFLSLLGRNVPVRSGGLAPVRPAREIEQSRPITALRGNLLPSREGNRQITRSPPISSQIATKRRAAEESSCRILVMLGLLHDSAVFTAVNAAGASPRKSLSFTIVMR